MSRLTGRNKHGGIISLITGVHTDVERVRLLHKLCAYEDIGEPDELVKPVRCGKCCIRNSFYCPMSESYSGYESNVEDDDYCSYGEPREDTNDGQ